MPEGFNLSSPADGALVVAFLCAGFLQCVGILLVAVYGRGACGCALPILLFTIYSLHRTADVNGKCRYKLVRLWKLILASLFIDATELLYRLCFTPNRLDDILFMGRTLISLRISERLDRRPNLIEAICII